MRAVFVAVEAAAGAPFNLTLVVQDRTSSKAVVEAGGGGDLLPLGVLDPAERRPSPVGRCPII